MTNKTALLMLAILPFAANAENKEEKNPEDPTKVVTKFGASYNGDVNVSGSIGLDQTRMINGSANTDGSEWRLGGSWLFDIGILNFNISKSTYDDDSNNISYSVGTFVPLSLFDIQPLGWQMFAMGGYNYTDGEKVDPEYYDDPSLDRFMPIKSHGGYLGMFALKPLSDKWTTMAFGGATIGSGDSQVYWGGAGLSYRITEAQSMNIFGTLSESSIYGYDDSFSISYRFEFN